MQCRAARALALLLLLAGAVRGVTRVENVRPSGNGKYTIPQYPANTRYGVTYNCLIADANRFPGRQWMVGLRDHNDGQWVHHMVLYTIPVGSPLLMPGGAFHGVQDGDVIDDCQGINSAPSHPPYILYADQAGNDDLALLSGLGEDGSSANGYPFGVPIGTEQIGAAFLAFQMHIDNPDFEEGVETQILFQVRTTTDAPDLEGGMIFAGVSPPIPTFPDDAFMHIGVNADGEHTISATTQPAALACATTPAAVPCVSCCPIVPPVRLDNAPYEGRMERFGLDNVLIMTGFLHAHHLQKELRAWTVGFDGATQLVDECVGCGHHAGVNAFHILPQPVVFNAGEGFRVKCVYHNAAAHNGHTHVIGGYRSDQEMCLFFGYYAAPVGASLRPGGTLTYGGQCDNVQNEGYPNQNRALALYPFLDALLCRGNCPFDPLCPH